MECRLPPACNSVWQLQLHSPRSDACSTFHSCHNPLCLQVDRIEVSRRYLLRGSAPLTAEEKEHFAALVHDRMTEQVGWAGWLGQTRTDAVLCSVEPCATRMRNTAAVQAVAQTARSLLLRLMCMPRTAE